MQNVAVTGKTQLKTAIFECLSMEKQAFSSSRGKQVHPNQPNLDTFDILQRSQDVFFFYKVDTPTYKKRLWHKRRIAMVKNVRLTLMHIHQHLKIELMCATTPLPRPS